MAINQIPTNFAPINKIKAYENVQKGGAVAGEQAKETEAPSFGDALKMAITEVDALQKDADNKIEAMVLGKPGVTPHQAMIALEKADVAFQMMNMVRGKIVQAYQEVMRTQF